MHYSIVLNGVLRVTVTGVGVYALDLEGRPLFFEHEFKSYERGLSGHVLYKTWSRGRRVVRVLPREERDKLLSKVYAALREALADSSGEAKHYLGVAVERGLAWLLEDEKRFRSLYLPVSILPPDHYLSVVLQAVEGCIYNKCSFCNFYKDRRYRAKSPEEFREHARKVRVWLGLGVLARRTVFISDANPLSAPREWVLEYFKIARDVFPEAEGLYAFADYFSSKLEPEDYSRLAETGLRRVYMGLESGSVDVLKLLGKPPSPESAIKIARMLRDTGISRGIIVLVGAGGRSLWSKHVEETVSVISVMDPEKDDIVFLSRLLVWPELPYARAVSDHLTGIELDRQEAEFRDKLVSLGVKVASYNILESVY